VLRYIPLMFKNALRNRRRSLLTIGSIAVSLCVLGLLMALYHGLFLAGPATPAQALRLVVHHRVSMTQPIPMSYLDRVRRIPGVRAAQEWDWFGGTYKDARDQRNFFARFIVEPDKLFIIQPEIKLPEDQKQAFLRERTGCIVGKDTAEKFNWKIGDRITLVGDIWPVTLELKLVGIYENPLDSASMYFNDVYPREALRAAGITRRMDAIGAIQLIVDGPADVSRVQKAIDKEFDNSPFPTMTETEQSFVLAFASFLGNLKVYLMAICGAITFTILLVAANTISMSVRERVREVGVLKTLGFTPGSILGIILGESVVISVIGGIIGCVLAAMLVNGARHAPGAMGFTRGMAMTPGVIAVCIAMAAFVGLISSLFPAWSASRISIVEALRHTG
jgi:putative ABC transport system permease protein